MLFNGLKQFCAAFDSRKQLIREEAQLELQRLKHNYHFSHHNWHRRVDPIDRFHYQLADLNHEHLVYQGLIKHFIHSFDPLSVDTLQQVDEVDPNKAWLYSLERRRARGAVIIETSIALSFLLPIVFFILLSIVQGVQFFTIKNGLTEAANRAARSLSVAYWENEDIAYDRSLQESTVLDAIRMPGVINSTNQFQIVQFDVDSNPPTVTVTVVFHGGEYNLPPFPNPDPLNLGSDFSVTGTATQAIQ